MNIELKPIAVVRGGRSEIIDDNWGEVNATIELDHEQFSPQALAGLSGFSHLVVVFFFHRVSEAKIERSARRPRNNPDWPMVGIFAQRGKNRPNRLGVSVCRILSVDGWSINVQGLDAIDGTPVLDIKPHMTDFEAQGEVREPHWARELMQSYW